MRLSDLLVAMEEIAPTRHAESWDNVGLLTGDPAQDISRVLLTIDYTAAVADEARGQMCQAVVAYHPPIFDGLKRITADGAGALIFDAILRGIAIYSPHTAWDAAEGGSNDVLAEAAGLEQRQPLRLGETKSKQYKLVVFVPEDALERVSEAMFSAGAGRIGKYSSCSFRSAGMGTFYGEAGTSPAVGESGRLETAEEMRLETVVAIDKVEAVIKALRETHPYEEPAFDLNQLAVPPEGIGMGRIGELAGARKVSDVAARIKQVMELAHVLIAGDGDRAVRRIAVCAGAGRSMMDDCIKQRADLFLTGELPHHDALRAVRAGMAVICTLHSNSERASLKRLKSRLQDHLPALEIVLSQADRDPFAIR